MKSSIGKIIGLMLVFLVSFTGSAAWAGAVLHIGNPPNAGTYLYGSEVLPISSKQLGILENGNGQLALVDPALLLILGVPNVDSSTFTAPFITLSTGTGSIGGTNLFGGSWNTTTGYAGSFTAASLGGVYNFIGLSPSGNASNNFGNWAGADLAVNGIVANSFGIFVYQLTGTGISGGETVWVDFASALDKGIFAVAYGQAYGQNDKVKAFTTPFTESGLTVSVPEAGALLLFGTGLVGLVGYRRVRRMK